MNRCRIGLLSTLFVLCLVLSGCSTGPTEHYVSPRIKGEAEKINLDEVQKAFWDSKGNDLNSWMAAFEKRVNEIYEGNDVIAIDATRNDNRLIVTGYIDKDNKDGYQSGDEKLFCIEQTGEAVNNEMPYRVSGYYGHPYYEGHHSFLGNPFLQGMLLSHVLGGWGGHYYTPRTQTVILRDHRDSFRQSPQYGTQQSSNQGFFSRFKSKPSGGLESSKKFGSTDFSSGGSEKKRFFGGSSSTSSTSSSSSSSSGWGGRRSSGMGGLFSSGGSRRSWGGRRR
jgi:hypothetical protein